jgi:hypothetical protein
LELALGVFISATVVAVPTDANGMAAYGFNRACVSGEKEAGGVIPFEQFDCTAQTAFLSRVASHCESAMADSFGALHSGGRDSGSIPLPLPAPPHVTGASSPLKVRQAVRSIACSPPF